MPTRPVVVAFLRGLLEAVVLAVLGFLIVSLSEVDGGELAPWAPIGLLVLRQLEGLADERIDPTKQRGPLGGAPAERGAVTITTGAIVAALVIVLLIVLL